VAGACQWPFRAVSVLDQGHKPVHPCSPVADHLFAQKQKLVQVGKTNQKIDLVTFAPSYFSRHLEQCHFNQKITSRYGVLILKPSFLLVLQINRQQMSLGIVVDDSKEAVPSLTRGEAEQLIRKEMDLFIAAQKKPDNGFSQLLEMERKRFFKLGAQSVVSDAPEPSSTTTTTTTTTEDGWIPYNMKSSQFGEIEDFPQPPVIVTPAMLPYVLPPTETKAEPSATTTAGEAKVEMVIREASAFNLGLDDDETPPALSGSSDEESEPNTTATTTTTTTTEVKAVSGIIDSIPKHQWSLIARALPWRPGELLRFSDPVGGGIGAPVSTTVVAVPIEIKASETEEFYAALDKERSAWKRETDTPFSMPEWHRHHLRAPSTRQDEEAMRKVGLPPFGWICTACSRFFDYPSTACTHAWRPCWPGRGPTVEEVD